MLLANGNPLFNQTIEGTYERVREKIVDQALQTAGFKVFVFPNYFISETQCGITSEAYAKEGAAWVTLQNGLSYCMQLYRVQAQTMPCNVGLNGDTNAVCGGAGSGPGPTANSSLVAEL